MNSPLSLSLKSDNRWRLYRIDSQLIVATVCLLGLGVVMVGSASMEYAAHNLGEESYFLKRHLMYLLCSCAAFSALVQIPVSFWQKVAPVLLIAAIGLLLLILLPGVGFTNKGATRWLRIGGFTLQISELVKFALVTYIASYLVRQRELITTTFIGFLNPLIVISVIIVLLLAQPDFGSVVVLLGASLGMLFLGGVKVWQFTLLMVVSVGSMAAMIFSEEYRRDRFFAYLDPWSHRQDGGYQLIESLIAFGRGEWFGSGLGNSMQKQFYLPEAHNDFIFAVLSEELGFIGSVLVIVLFAMLLYRIVSIARSAELMDELFAAFYCYGVALVLFIQLFINLGVNTGLLPTKGLTLPFLSYGGTSLLISFCMLAVVFRANSELVNLLSDQQARKGRVVKTSLSVRQMQ